MTSMPPESDRPTPATPLPSAAEPGDTSLVVEVFDQPFRLASSSTNADEIRRAAAYLDDRMRAIASKRGRGVALELAILAAMEVADEMLTTQQRREHLLADADEQIGRFTQALGAGDNEEANQG